MIVSLGCFYPCFGGYKPGCLHHDFNHRLLLSLFLWKKRQMAGCLHHGLLLSLFLWIENCEMSCLHRCFYPCYRGLRRAEETQQLFEERKEISHGLYMLC